MKKLKFITILFIGILVMNSCKEYLDLSPISEIAIEGFYSNNTEVEAGVIAIYDGMQTMVQTEYALTEMRSDNSKTRNREGEGAQFETMNVDPGNSIVAAYWANNYNIIFRANIVLENLGAVTVAAKKSQFEGEAKFARALCHFNLVRAFGNIPLVKQVIRLTDDKALYTQAPKNEVYASIISDLKDAAGMLPARAGIAEGRATKDAANALLGKVYLTTGDFTSAKNVLGAISSTDYSLLPLFNDVFYKERSKEIIFAVQFINDNSLESELFSLDFTSKGRATGLNLASDDLMAAVDPADKRKPTLFYLEPAINKWECGKYLSNSTNSSYSGNDWIVLRYADILLMQAEAILAGNASTSDATAVAAFNAIRTRAGLPTVTAVTKDALLKERRVELAFENQRLYDLVRFGVADAVMGAFSLRAEANFTYSPTALLLPIPQREINLYNKLSQNPGYNK
jgi:hypothetical protein